jgi:signal transduction histidine kinase
VFGAPQIVMNAINNAAKHAPPSLAGTPVGITITATAVPSAGSGSGAALVIEVSDAGPGLRGRTLAELVHEFGGGTPAGTPARDDSHAGAAAIRSSGTGTRLRDVM